MAHYESHESFDGDSFWEFIMEDYASHQGDHEGHHSDGHEDLPFHGQHQCNHAPLVVSLHLNTIKLDLPPSFLQTHSSHYIFSISSAHLDQLIQPPKA